MPVGSETIDIVVETLADALTAARREKRRLETEADGLREYIVGKRAERQEAVDSASRALAERDEARKRIALLAVQTNYVTTERDDALRKLAQAEGHNDLLRDQNAQLQAALKVAKQCSRDAEAWNRGLTQANNDLITEIAELKKGRGAGPTRPEWERTVAENVAAQAILDSAEPELAAAEMAERSLEKARQVVGDAEMRDAALSENEDDYPTYYCQKCKRRTPHRPSPDTPEFWCVGCGSVRVDQWRYKHAQFEREQKERDPQFTAQELRDAKAVVEAEQELERTGRGEPTTEECPACRGFGGWKGVRGEFAFCDRCHGTGRVLVHDDAPKHLDTEREGAADHAMSLDDDTD